MASSSTTAPSRSLLFASYALLALAAFVPSVRKRIAIPTPERRFSSPQAQRALLPADDHGASIQAERALLPADDHGASTSKTKAIGEPPWRFDRHWSALIPGDPTLSRALSFRSWWGDFISSPDTRASLLIEHDRGKTRARDQHWRVRLYCTVGGEESRACEAPAVERKPPQRARQPKT